MGKFKTPRQLSNKQPVAGLARSVRRERPGSVAGGDAGALAAIEALHQCDLRKAAACGRPFYSSNPAAPKRVLRVAAQRRTLAFHRTKTGNWTFSR
jgi:hypothetical protein